MSEKQKLTLSVSKKVVEKAKEVGINISEITENVLRGFAFTPKELNDEEFYAQYKVLFEVMMPLMKKYDFSVRIASSPIFDKDGIVIDFFDYSLTPSGVFWVFDVEHGFSEIEKIPVHELASPNTILERFIKNLAQGVEKRKEKIAELEMAKQIILAITGTMERRESAQNRD